MAHIEVLDKQVAELIAAGEVVDRPASVVKELVENSIDAGATALTVEIKHGGVTFIRVSDDGSGIARQEVPTAFLRHATSKVRKQDDLDQISTLGFRGEALASVAAMAQVEMFTRTQDELAGTHYRIAGGEQEVWEEAGCAQGTTLVIRDLFYNTPARMKFLKSDAAESRAVGAVLDHIALSHPEVSIRFLRDGKEELHTPGDGNLKSAVYAVYGREFTLGLIPVEYELNGVKVFGFISKPSAARPNRSMQQFFINGRCVKTRTVMAALEEAFKGSLMVGKFPACILHLELSCQAVDVNVHPTKLEVRFFNERPVFDAVYHGVKTALNEGDTPASLVFPAESQQKNIRLETPQKDPMKHPKPSAKSPFSQALSASPNLPAKPKGSPPVFFPKAPDEFRDGPSMLNDSVKSNTFTKQPPERQKTPVSVKKPPVSQPAFFSDGPVPEGAEEMAPSGQVRLSSTQEPRLLGEAFGTYILAELNSEELLLIDKHAAHERLLYEQLKEQQSSQGAQMLLEPVTVTLSKQEYAAVLDALEMFAEAGFELEDFGAGTVLVRSAPLALEKGDLAGAVMEMAGYLESAKTDLTCEQIDWLYHNIACRAAVKAGDVSAPLELAALAKRLQEHPEIRYCPHGRPVSIVIKRQDLEKQFGRT